MADQSINNPDGAFGYSGLDQQLPNKYVELECSADVSAGYVVGIGTTGKVAHCTTVVTTALGTIIGVAANAASSATSTNGNKPGIVKVITEGYAEVAMSGVQTAGSFVTCSATTSGVGTPVATTTAVLAHAYVGRVLADEATAGTLVRNVKCWISRAAN